MTQLNLYVDELDQLRHEYGVLASASAALKADSFRLKKQAEAIKKALMNDLLEEAVNRREIIAETNPTYKAAEAKYIDSEYEYIKTEAKRDAVWVNIEVLRSMASATKKEINFQ